MDNRSAFRNAVRLVSLKIRHFRISMSGRPTSDLSYKQQRLLSTGLRYHCDTFVETGTYLGDTVRVMKGYFDTVLSAELSEELSRRNGERFKHCRNVSLWCGSSGKLMPEMLRRAGDGRIIFWLDAHYSGTGTAGAAIECPLLSELAAIAAAGRNDHCILIDDARCFADTPGYPSVGQIREMLLAINPAFRITVENDCIAALPPW